MKISVGASSFGSGSGQAEKLLAARGYTVIRNPYGRKLTQEETIRHLQGSVGLLAGLEPLNEQVFSACPELKAIVRIGIGMDNVDLDAARRHGITVSNTPEGPTKAVAEMTLTALLALERQLFPANEDVHTGVWKKRLGRSLPELKVLVIGYGRIGQEVGRLLRSLGAQLLIYDKYQTKYNTGGTLGELLAQADVVTLHAAGRDEILGAEELAKMKEGAIILNSARGTLVNEDALYRELASGRLGGYWGDALWEEPYHGKLCSLSNAILTPHICTYTTQCRESMELQAAEKLLEALDGI